MSPAILATFVVLLPVIVLFSGMAMSPLLFILMLVIVGGVHRTTLLQPRMMLPNYKTLFGALGLLLVLPLLSALWSITPGHSISTSFAVTLGCVAGAIAFMYIPALSMPTPKLLKYFAISFAVVTALVLQELVIPGGGLLYFIYTNINLSYERFVDKNINRGLCALVVFVWPLVMGFYLTGKKQYAWLVLALLAATVLPMHSLSAKVGLVASVAAFFALRRYPVTMGRALVILFPLFLLSFPFLFKLMEYSFFAQPMVREHLPGSALHRLGIWHVLYDVAMQKPWFGWGMDTTRATHLTLEQLGMISLNGPPLHPHSPSIQILLEQGIIGLLLSVVTLFLLLREWMRMPLTHELQRAAAGALIVAYFAAGVSSFGLWQHWWIATLWIAGMLWRWMGQERPLGNA